MRLTDCDLEVRVTLRSASPFTPPPPPASPSPPARQTDYGAPEQATERETRLCSNALRACAFSGTASNKQGFGSTHRLSGFQENLHSKFRNNSRTFKTIFVCGKVKDFHFFIIFYYYMFIHIYLLSYLNEK